MPDAKVGQPEVIASAVSYLCSPEAHFITGQSPRRITPCNPPYATRDDLHVRSFIFTRSNCQCLWRTSFWLSSWTFGRRMKLDDSCMCTLTHSCVHVNFFYPWIYYCKNVETSNRRAYTSRNLILVTWDSTRSIDPRCWCLLDLGCPHFSCTRNMLALYNQYHLGHPPCNNSEDFMLCAQKMAETKVLNMSSTRRESVAGLRIGYKWVCPDQYRIASSSLFFWFSPRRYISIFNMEAACRKSVSV